MPGAARLLTDRIAVLTVRLMLREQRLMGEAAQGIDDPTTDKHMIALHNAFSRSIQRLEEMRARDGANGNRTPSLDEYLAARSANGTVTAIMELTAAVTRLRAEIGDASVRIAVAVLLSTCNQTYLST
jgi:hypothetical protein